MEFRLWPPKRRGCCAHARRRVIMRGDPRQVESDVTKCTKLMAEADAEVAKHKDVARELKAAKAEIQSNEEEMWRVDRETQHFKRQEATSRERIHRLDEQGAIKMEAAQTAVAAAMDDRNAVQSHNAATQAKIAELDHQVCTYNPSVATRLGPLPPASSTAPGVYRVAHVLAVDAGL